jgi:UDP-glucose 4-epimerase
MIVLVTGGAGYIGSHFVLALQDAGHDAVVLDDLSTGDLRAVPPYVPFVRGDVGDHETLREVFGRHAIDAVVHFAGSLVVSQSVAEPMEYYRNNVIGSHALIEASRAAGVRDLVFSSTAAVYGSTRGPVDETAPTRPLSPYGRSKLAVEWMLEDAARAYGLRVAALRYFNVAGADPYMRAGQRSKKATHLIKIVAEAAIGLRDRVMVFGRDYETRDGTCVRDYVHVSDLAAMHLHALEWLRAGGDYGVFNCGYGEGASVLDVIDAGRRISGSAFTVVDAERRPGDPDVVIAAPLRAISVLGWRPKHADLNEIVSHSIEWERRLRDA